MEPVNPGPADHRGTLRAERAAVTRRRIADAARRLFARDGYGATTLREIAAEAGVAVQTVYAVYGSKAGILRALRESAVHQPEAQASYRAAMAEHDPARRLGLFARSIRQRWELAGDIVAIHRDAAMVDPGVRPEVDEVLRRRRGGLGELVRSLEGSLRPGIDVARATAIVDALTLPEVYAELVHVQGWTPGEHEAWLTGVLQHELLGE